MENLIRFANPTSLVSYASCGLRIYLSMVCLRIVRRHVGVKHSYINLSAEISNLAKTQVRIFDHHGLSQHLNLACPETNQIIRSIGNLENFALFVLFLNIARPSEGRTGVYFSKIFDCMAKGESTLSK